MSDTRGKLTELLAIIFQPGQKTLGDIADYLVANGVTTQRWIPAGRPPREDGEYLVYRPFLGHDRYEVLSFAKDGTKIDIYDSRCPKRSNVWYKYDGNYGYVSVDGVTAWTTLPKLPKGDQLWFSL